MHFRDFLPKDFHKLEPAAKQSARIAAFEAEKTWKAARKIELAAEKAERAQHEMTCQVCARGIMANTGLIAHHGYQRPGEGWQTASCSGAKELPFEVSRDALAEEIVHAREYAKMRAAFAADVRAEKAPVSLKYSVLIESTRTPYYSPSRFEDRVLAGVTRENFEAKKVECPEAFKEKYGRRNPKTYGHDPFTFEDSMDQFVRPIERDAEETAKYADRQQARYDGWSQTHERRDGKWMALEVTA